MAFESIKESERYLQIQAYYEKLSPRDQLAVKCLAAFLAFVVIVFGLLVPVTQYNSSAQSDYQAAVDTINWMKANQQAFAGAKTQTKREPGQSLLSIANQSSQKFNINFKRFEPVGEDGLSIWLDDVAFNNMIVWLELLDKRYGIQVQEISVDRDDKKGQVNVRLVLQG